jgi:hypothetical protein
MRKRTQDLRVGHLQKRIKKMKKVYLLASAFLGVDLGGIDQQSNAAGIIIAFNF